MKIAVVSDTHGNLGLAVKALDRFGLFDLIIHLGDTSEDAEIIETAIGQELVKIRGNCDLSWKYPKSANPVLAGKRFFITHGDLFQVKSGLSKIYQKARREKADVVLFGHTHSALVEEIDGILFMNPGTLKKQARMPSMGILVIEAGSVRAEIVDLNEI